jgi:hypothetical protein
MDGESALDYLLHCGTGSTPSHCPKGDHRDIADAIDRPAC